MGHLLKHAYNYLEYGNFLNNYYESILNTPPWFIVTYTNLWYEINMLLNWKRLGEDICNLFICSTVFHCYDSICYKIPDEMIAYLYMLRCSMKCWILRHCNCGFIVTKYFRCFFLFLMKIFKKSSKPYCLTICYGYIFCFRCQ